MSDKLTASVVTANGLHWACLRNDMQTFHGVEPVYDEATVEGARESAQSVADTLTKAIAKHDKAVNAELLALRDRLGAALRDLHDEQNGPPSIRDKVKWHASMTEAEAVLAIVEKADDK